VSVANLTRRDGLEFLELAPKVPVRTTVQAFPLEQANDALARLREGRINGAAVLITSSEQRVMSRSGLENLISAADGRRNGSSAGTVSRRIYLR
jgi:hypothetical protein